MTIIANERVNILFTGDTLLQYEKLKANASEFQENIGEMFLRYG